MTEKKIRQGKLDWFIMIATSLFCGWGVYHFLILATGGY